MQTKIRNWLLSTLAVAIFAIVGCNPQATSAPADSPSASPSATTSSVPTAVQSPPQSTNPPRLRDKATVVMMVKGSPITIEVNGTDAPITAGNFVDLVDKKVYDGLVFHRVVREPQPFVVQGGDPQGKDPNFPLERLGTGGYVDPATGQPRNIPLEIKPDKANDPIVYGKTLESKNPKLKHIRGAVAMLAGPQFLDGDYAVFGNVTQGMEVVDKIQQGDRIDSAKVTQGIENLKRG